MFTQKNKDIVYRLVNELDEYQHRIFVYDIEEWRDWLKENEIVFTFHICNLFVCKRETFISTIRYCETPFRETLPDSVTITFEKDLTNNKIWVISDITDLIFCDVSRDAFIGFDKHNPELPLIWKRMIKALYGHEKIPINVIVKTIKCKSYKLNPWCEKLH